MKYVDIKAMMAEIAPVIREYTSAVVEPLSERLDAIEAKLANLPASDQQAQDAAQLRALIDEVSSRIDNLPVPEKGEKGEPGRDGLGFDDMRMEEREDGCYLVFERGEIVKEFRVPVVIDRGVYSAGRLYRRGDGVTWAGSFWIAQEDTSEKPDTGKGWRLAVKKGRDGKDAK